MLTLEINKDPKGWQVRVLEDANITIVHKNREDALRILAGTLTEANAQLQAQPQGGYLASYSQISGEGASESQAKAALMKRLHAFFLEQLQARPK